jgi:hypothetical protein
MTRVERLFRGYTSVPESTQGGGYCEATECWWMRAVYNCTCTLERLGDILDRAWVDRDTSEGDSRFRD